MSSLRIVTGLPGSFNPGYGFQGVNIRPGQLCGVTTLCVLRVLVVIGAGGSAINPVQTRV